MCVFYKILNSMSRSTRRYFLRNVNNIPLVRVKNDFFMNTFFASAITEWN